MLCSRLLRLVGGSIHGRKCSQFIVAKHIQRHWLYQTQSVSTTSTRFDLIRKSNRTKLPNINIHTSMTVAELATALEKDTDHVFECLLFINTSKKVDNENSVLDFDVVQEVCIKSGVRGVVVARPSIDKKIEVNRDLHRRPEVKLSSCPSRPPVVTIMGHVDHGKTTLLDYLRKSNIVDQEFGGITQHIGAFSVKMKHGKSITFLDTPGHAAFSAMRGRGARLTDIIVLVVAADDGVMPQTIESIKHAMNSQVPIIVAINKCDRVEAEVEACMHDLAEHGIVLEQLGGELMGVQISALKGTNIDTLQDAIITQAELLDIRADPTGLVEARIIESKTEPGRGKVATLLVQRGTLKTGHYLVASNESCKVKGIYDDNRKPVQSAGPGTAVEVAGWKELPSPGHEVLQVENESKMKTVINYRKMQEQKLKEDEAWTEIKEKRKLHEKQHQQKLLRRQERGLARYTLRLRQEIGVMEAANELEPDLTPELPLIIRTDVDGSLEAITSCLATYDSDLCVMDMITSGVGVVTENDVELAHSFNGVIIAFNTTTSGTVGKLAAELKVDIRRHNIIYKLVDDVKDLLNGRIPKAVEHKTVGEAVIQKVFTVTEKIDNRKAKVLVAGCSCTDGMLYRHKSYKVVRGTDVVYTGTLRSLKHFKSEVEDIKESMECGLGLSDTTVEILEGDSVLCYEEHEYQPQVSWILPF